MALASFFWHSFERNKFTLAPPVPEFNLFKEPPVKQAALADFLLTFFWPSCSRLNFKKNRLKHSSASVRTVTDSKGTYCFSAATFHFAPFSRSGLWRATWCVMLPIWSQSQPQCLDERDKFRRLRRRKILMRTPNQRMLSGSELGLAVNFDRLEWWWRWQPALTMRKVRIFLSHQHRCMSALFFSFRFSRAVFFPTAIEVFG